MLWAGFRTRRRDVIALHQITRAVSESQVGELTQTVFYHPIHNCTVPLLKYWFVAKVGGLGLLA
jgi:hypothetical protein